VTSRTRWRSARCRRRWKTRSWLPLLGGEGHQVETASSLTPG